MKILQLFTFLLLMSFGQSNAQTKYEIKETEQNIRKGFEVLLPSSTMKDADNSVREFLKVYKAKIEYTDKNKTESMAMQTLIPSINSTPVDVYYNVIAMGADAKLYMYFNMGGLYVTSKGTPEKYAPALSIMNQVVGKIAFDKAQFQVDSVMTFQKTLEKELSVLEGDKKGIESSMEKNKKSISDNELEIKENERAIAKSQADQASVMSQITSEKTILATMNPDALRDRIKTIEGEIKDLQKTNEKSNSEIADKKGKISISQSSITSNKILIEANNKQNETLKTQKNVDAGSGLDPKVVKERIKILSDQQKEIEKSNEKLMSDNVKSEGEIQKINAEIMTLNNQIQTNQTSIQGKTKEKTETEQKISNNSLDERMKKVDEMQKTYDKMQKDQEKFSKDIDVSKADIEKLKQEIQTKETIDIPANAKAQSLKNVDIQRAKGDLTKVKSIQQGYAEMK